ncbi:uncharacterized mitochondrial protein AtMg00310-like [Henckelia pumila]|uniref:uncharacterized mitochondrial protein AtMg00310-like n=1 Tax=Henckelia pumila TaxID=405737 RepID=UPI003C6E1553
MGKELHSENMMVVVLIKSAAQAIPSYCMSTFLIPISLADELQRMLNSFWWGSKKNGGRSMHWLNWSKMCTTKDTGGLGFRDFMNFNIAMLGKQGWRLISDPDALVCKVLKAKYYPTGDFLNAKLGHNPSYIWRSIWSSQVLLAKGIRWKIEYGRNIRVWTDPWLRDPKNHKMETLPIP